MGKRGFSATTFVLIAVLFGALFMVGKTVIPPPPGPPTPPPAPVNDPKAKPLPPGGAMSAENRARMMAEMKKHQVEAQQHSGTQAAKPKFDPNQMDIESGWHNHRTPGVAGEKQMAEMVAKAKADQAAEQALHPSAPPKHIAIPPMSQ